MSITNATLSTGAAAAVYTSSGSSAITTMYLCNRTAGPVTVNLFVVASGAVASQTNNMIYSNLVINSNDTYVMEWERILLSNGDTIAANASATNSIVSTISYTGI